MKSHLYQYLSLKLRSYGTYIQNFSFLVLIAKASIVTQKNGLKITGEHLVFRDIKWTCQLHLMMQEC